MEALRHAVVAEGKVVNVVMAYADHAEANGWIPSDFANIGDDYIGGEFICPPQPEIPEGEA